MAKAAKVSPTQRTLKFLRDAGYAAGIVEHHNHYAGPPHMRCGQCGKNRIGVKRDLFGWVDIIGCHPSKQGTLFVQTTSGDHHANRLDKILESDDAKKILQAGNSIWVMSWRRLGRQRRWEPRVTTVTIGMFEERKSEKGVAS